MRNKIESIRNHRNHLKNSLNILRLKDTATSKEEAIIIEINRLKEIGEHLQYLQEQSPINRPAT